MAGSLPGSRGTDAVTLKKAESQDAIPEKWERNEKGVASGKSRKRM